MDKLKNKKYLLTSIFILMLITISLSYAYWQFNKVQQDLNMAGTNCFSLTYTDNTDSLILDNIVPTEDEEGLKEKGYSFTIENTCNTIATYEVNLEDILASSNIKHMPNKYIKVSLNDSTPKVLNTYEEVKTTISNATNSFKLTSGSLKPDEEATYELKLWMDSETPAIDEVMSATFESKITVNTSYIEEENLTNDITIVATSQNEDYSKDKETFTIDITSTNKNIIEYSFNNQNWTSVTPNKEIKFNYDFVEEKNYTLYVKDEVGNVKTTEIIPSKLDQTVPEIKIETTNNHESYTLKVNLMDTKSGVESYQITTTKEEPTEWLSYTNVIEKEITENNTYYIWSKDKVGNISYETIVIDKIDKEAPNIELSHTLTDWGVKDTIQIHLTDDIIGLSGYQIMTSEKEPTDYISLDNSLEENLTYEVIENGTYYIYAKDAYNHVSHKKIVIDKIDNELPSQSFDIESSILGENDWYQSLTIKTTLLDSQSGISSSKYCVTTEGSCTPDKEATITNNEFTVSLETNSLPQKLCVNTTDKVGNTSHTTCTESYFIDNTKPVAKISATVSGTNITVSAKGTTDEGSGIATYYYSKDGGASYVTSETTSYTFTNLDKGTYHLALKVKDKAGNLSETEELEQSTIYPERATTFITNLASKADSSSTDVYTVPSKTSDTCDYTLAYDGTIDNNLRYVGANPCNYVKVDGEYWRIIGVMNNIDDGTGTKETRLKLIRDESIGSYSWDTSDSSVNNGYGVNEWSQADIMKLLNPGYLTESVGGSLYYYGKSGNCYNGASNANASCDFITTGLKDNLKQMIDNVVWNTGTNGTNDYTSSSNGLSSHFYNYERSTNTGKICTNETYCNDTVERTTTWQGKVGLVYPSDYGYATSGGSTSDRTSCLSKELYNWDSSSSNDCKNHDWLYNLDDWQWSLSPSAYSSYARGVFIIYGTGAVNKYSADYSGVIRPSVYLLSKTAIIGGEGTKEEPYELKLEEDYNEDMKSCGGTAECVLANASKSDEIATDDPDGNARYIGENPNNYVYIDNEYWRIIGAFKNIDDGTGTKETRLKLIRDESIGNYSWDSSESSVNGGGGVNEWSQADIMKLLNPGYLTEKVGGSLYYYGKSGNCYNGISNANGSCDFTTTGLKDNLKQMIDNVIWNTGANDGILYIQENIISQKFYELERSGNNGKICTSGVYCNDNLERTTNWIGKVGLIYPSDYAYATSGGDFLNRKTCQLKPLFNWNEMASCYNHNWLMNYNNNQWSIMPYATSTDAIGAFSTRITGSLGAHGSIDAFDIKPVVYLKSFVKISSGIGSKSNPYIMSES